MITVKKIFLSTLVIATCLTGCSKNEKKEPTQADIASAAEAQAVPMSAMPADEKTTPAIINDNNTAVDLSGEITDSNTPSPASDNPENTDNTDNDDVDNSAMENISEDAEIIDDEPASPNAPKANDSTESVNQKVK